jgi:hypothetical protein
MNLIGRKISGEWFEELRRKDSPLYNEEDLDSYLNT